VRAEQVELDFPGDVDHAGLVGFPCGEVAGFEGFAGAGPVGAVADEGGGCEDFQQEGGEREVSLLMTGRYGPENYFSPDVYPYFSNSLECLE